MSLERASEVAAEACRACHDLLRDPELGAVVNHGLTICYGPVRHRPGLDMITFQGGGADRTIQRAPPERFLYASDPYRVGTAVRRYATAAGMSSLALEDSIAHPAVFCHHLSIGCPATEAIRCFATARELAT